MESTVTQFVQEHPGLCIVALCGFCLLVVILGAASITRDPR